MSEDRIKKFNWCIIGGPYHGTKVGESHGLKPVSMMPANGSAASGRHLECIPHRFVVGDNESCVTVFSPPDMLDIAIEDFLSGMYEDFHMRDYDVWQNIVYPPKEIKLQKVRIDHE